MPLLAQEAGSWLQQWAPNIIRTAAIAVVGFPAVFALASVVGRSAKKRLSAQSAMLINKLVLYGGLALLLVMVLGNMGFQLSALLGAAGIAGIAIGFASQTSVSNIISGLFLIWEKPFEVGDFVKVGDTMGSVLSIDLLSVKLRTFDNQFIRLPNETLIKTTLSNFTRFPIRRFDIQVGVAYKEDLARVEKLLREVANANAASLEEPEPFVAFRNFGDSALEFTLGVWAAKEDFMMLRTTIMREIKERFDAEGIEIPFPHRTFYTGSECEPLPIRLVNGSGELPAGK